MNYLRMDLKVCEGCGVLWLRTGSALAVYCRGCSATLAEFPAPRRTRTQTTTSCRRRSSRVAAGSTLKLVPAVTTPVARSRRCPVSAAVSVVPRLWAVASIASAASAVTARSACRTRKAPHALRLVDLTAAPGSNAGTGRKAPSGARANARNPA